MKYVIAQKNTFLANELKAVIFPIGPLGRTIVIIPSGKTLEKRYQITFGLL